MNLKQSLNRLSIFIILILLPLFLTGCGDMVEIQDRDFVLAIGVSYVGHQYQVTYALPNLGQITEQSSAGDQSSLIRTYEGNSLPEIDQRYNFNSENRLDYRHLQVIIFDQSICSNQQAMKDLLIQINDNYNISHNVLVYFYPEEAKDLMSIEGVNGSIGEHLKKLNNNNRINGTEPAKIGSLIDGIYNDRTLFIPTLYNRDNSIAINGGLFFQNNRSIKQVSQQDSDFYYITLGKNNDYLLRLSENQLIQLKQLKAKVSFQKTADKPYILFKISGTAISLPRNSGAPTLTKQQLNEFIRHKIELELSDFFKGEQIDYLNLYEKSSYKNRSIWVDYENRHADFINDTITEVIVDIHYE